MTNQEAFDKMMEHLRSLKARSLSPLGVCAYNGSKCAVGALMTDEEQEKFGYSEEEVYFLLRQMQAVGHKSTLHTLEIDFLTKMQWLHDNKDSWSGEGFDAEDKAKRVAEQFNLTYTNP
ncbi:MAG: hypothetical protein MJH10_19065 [Epibacterium sp.]|nr:hypothetical protein [Epibacterium sp.]NQX75584.1 hypothetical protein [Epibacterium sp.]